MTKYNTPSCNQMREGTYTDCVQLFVKAAMTLWYLLMKDYILGSSHSLLQNCSLKLHFIYGRRSHALKLAALQQVCNDLTEVETLKKCVIDNTNIS